MIPRTFPSTFAANGQQQMVVYSLPSITGLTAWIDYIPVKGVTTESATLENTYANGGYQVVDSLASLTGKQAWLDYIPVYEDASYTKPWSTDAGGYIPTSALAALLLDFTSGRLDPRITFSRTTNATLTNSAGLVANAPMNLLTFSEQFDNAAWTKTSTAVTSNSTVAPDGTTTADTLVGTGSYPFIQGSVTYTAAAYTFSVFVKKSTGTFALAFSAAGAIDEVAFNLATGATTTAGANITSSGYVDQGLYWRVWAVSTRTAVISQPRIFTGYPTNVSPVVWGAQLELGSTATTYNPTTVKNLLGYTEHFDNAAWTKSNASITSGFTDIYGQPFAQKLVEDTVSANHQVSIFATFTVGTPYTLSIYAKAAERSWLLCIPNSITQGAAWFNLATGTVGTVQTGVTSATIQPVGNGWYRCNVSGVATLTSNPPTFRLALADNTTVYTGDGTSGIYIFGAQLSDSASVDPYVYQPVAAPSSVAYYGPRFDYDPVTLAPKGLLIEEQRTNLLERTEDFSNAYWTLNSIFAFGSGSVVNATTAPDGTLTADKICSSGGTAAVSRGISGTVATTYTASCYFKAAGKNFAHIQINLTGGSILASFFTANLTTGEVGTQQDLIGSMTATLTCVAVGTDGWFRFSINVVNSGGNTTFTPFFGLSDAQNSRTTTSSATDGIFIWGAQLEAGAFATSYIPTVASQVTRAADSASMIGNNFARWYNQTEGTLYSGFSQYSSTSPNNQWIATLTDGTTNNYIGSLTNPSSYRALIVSGGATQASIINGAVAANTATKTSLAYKVNDFAATSNGAVPVADTSGVVPIVSQLSIGSINNSNQLNGHISRIAYYNRRLSNTELQGITS